LLIFRGFIVKLNLMKTTGGKSADRFHILLATILSLMLWGLGGLTGVSVQAAQVADRIVAVVNDDVILLSELDAAVAPFVERLAQMGHSTDKEQQMRYKIREDVLEQLIDRKLTDQEVKRLGLTVEPAEIDIAIERVKEDNFLTDETLREAMRQQGYSLEQYRANVRDQILRTKLVNREIRSRTVITSADVKAYYESHPEAFGAQRRYHLRTILLLRDTSDLSRQQQLVDEALEKGMPFDEAARRFSRAPQAADGGDLGAFSLASLSAQVRQAVEPLSEGQYGAWVDTDQGYQRFYVEKITPIEGKPLQEVEARIQETLYKQFVDEKFRSWLESLRSRSHIRIVK
jgi:peptidyl-prolyl cis-trans isomerase SurA